MVECTVEEVYSVKRSTDKCHVGQVSMEQVHSGEQSQVYNVRCTVYQCTVYSEQCVMCMVYLKSVQCRTESSVQC